MPAAGNNKLAEAYAEGGDEAVRRLIRKTLWEKDGSTSEASRDLGMTRAVLRYHLKKLGMLDYPEKVRLEVARRFNPRRQLPQYFFQRHNEKQRGKKESEMPAPSPATEQLRALVTMQPETAKKQILVAYSRARCSMNAAAKELCVNVWTLQRYVRKLQLGKVLEEEKARALREGWHHQPAPGPGRGHKREGTGR